MVNPKNPDRFCCVQCGEDYPRTRLNREIRSKFLKRHDPEGKFCSLRCAVEWAMEKMGKLAELEAEVERLLCQTNDLALIVRRLIRRVYAARAGEGLAVDDDSLAQAAIKYLYRNGLASPDCGEAGHDEGRCGNASCSDDALEAKGGE